MKIIKYGKCVQAISMNMCIYTYMYFNTVIYEHNLTMVKKVKKMKTTLTLQYMYIICYKKYTGNAYYFINSKTINNCRK